MTIQLKQLIWLLGGLLLGIALILGFMPVKANGIGCGTALTGQSDEARVADFTNTLSGGSNSLPGFTGDLLANEHSCSDSISGRRTVTFALGIPGAVLLLIAGAGVADGAIARWDERNA